MEDLLYRGIIDQLNIRFVLADCQQTVNDIILKHDCDPVSAAIFANAISSAALVSSLLTEDEKYTLKWRNDGQLGLVMADCDAQGHVRALISNLERSVPVATANNTLAALSLISFIIFAFVPIPILYFDKRDEKWGKRSKNVLSARKKGRIAPPRFVPSYFSCIFFLKTTIAKKKTTKV